MLRRAMTVSASAAALCLVVMSATPAAAATLPADNDLFAVTQDAFYSVQSNGASTFIADLIEQEGGKYGADFDVTNGLAYFFSSESTAACDLYSLDPATGVSALIGTVDDAGMDECDALNVDSDGVIRIADQDGVMATVDKTTGAVISTVTIIGPTAVSFIEQGSTGQFYVGEYSGNVHTLDVTTGATVFIAQPVEYIETASVDSDDTLWLSSDGGGVCSQGLSSTRLDNVDGSIAFEGDFTDGVDCLSAYAMFIVTPLAPITPEPPIAPELAATGPASLDAIVPLALLALIVGAGALISTRRTHTA